MNIKNILIILPLLLLSLSSISAQDNEPQRSSVVYLNGFGNALTYALTYDTRFGNTQNGWGGSIGVGGFAMDSRYFVNIPVQISYLFGEKNNFFEIGAGATFLASNMRWTEMGISGKSTTNIVGTLNFMYRLQMPKGFFLRTGWTPMFGQFHSNDFEDSYYGISLKGEAYFGVQPGWFGIGLGYCIR